jgi:hypothetical protein
MEGGTGAGTVVGVGMAVGAAPSSSEDGRGGARIHIHTRMPIPTRTTRRTTPILPPSLRGRRYTSSNSRRCRLQQQHRNIGTTARAPRRTTRMFRSARRRGSRFHRHLSRRIAENHRAYTLSRFNRGRTASRRLRSRPYRSERNGAAGERQRLRAVQIRRCGLPSVGGATDRYDPRQSRERRCSDRSRRRDGCRSGQRRCHRCRLRRPRYRSRGRVRSRIARRDGGRRGSGRGCGVVRTAALRRSVHAMHVRQGQPDPDPARVATRAGARGGISRAAATAGESRERPPSAAGKPAAATTRSGTLGQRLQLPFGLVHHVAGTSGWCVMEDRL